MSLWTHAGSGLPPPLFPDLLSREPEPFYELSVLRAVFKGSDDVASTTYPRFPFCGVSTPVFDPLVRYTAMHTSFLFLDIS